MWFFEHPSHNVFDTGQVENCCFDRDICVKEIIEWHPLFYGSIMVSILLAKSSITNVLIRYPGFKSEYDSTLIISAPKKK